MQTVAEVLSRLPRPNVPRLDAPAYTGDGGGARVGAKPACKKWPGNVMISGPEQMAVTHLTGPTRQAEGGPIMSEHLIPSDPAQQPTEETCSFPGCTRAVKVRSRRLCGTHYHSEWRSGRLVRVTPADRFWACVNKEGRVHPVHGQCWEWTGRTEGKGYGRLSVCGEPILAHRYSWTLCVGSIPDDMKVLHKCDNPACVNPGHLFLGTYADNNADRNAKGRQAKGENSGKAVLTDELVRELRAAVDGCKDPRKYGLFAEFSRRTGIHKNTLYAAAHGKSWRHVERTSHDSDG